MAGPSPRILRIMVRGALLLVMQWMALCAWSQALLFDRITMADGLPNNEVNTLFEDREGFVWAGTTDGLARLEGARIRVFQHDHNDSTNLAHDQVNGIAQDAAGRLWFATMDGLSLFDPVLGTFHNGRIAAIGNNARLANRMRQVLAVGDSLLWLVTEAGLYRFDIRRAEFRSVQALPEGKGPAGLVLTGSGLCWDPKRKVMWAGTQQGVASWDARTDRWTDHRTTAREPWGSKVATDAPMVQGDSLWFFRNKPYTLLVFDLRTGTLFPQPDIEDVPNQFSLRCQAMDPDGTHWLSTWTHRLFLRRPGSGWREVKKDNREPAGITSTRVGGLLWTRQGERWFATSHGISLVSGASSAYALLTFSGAPHNISVLRAHGADTLLVGTAGGGVHVLDLRTGRSSAYLLTNPPTAEAHEGAHNAVHYISGPRRGRYVVCTLNGLAELDPMRKAYVPMARTMNAMSIQGKLHCTFAEWAGDTLWVGTWQNGLWRYDPTSGVAVRVDTLPPPQGRLPSRMMLSWLKGADGRYWVGMNDGGGLAVRDAGGFRAITDERGANAGGVVRVLAEGPDGRIWMGTHEQGLAVYDPGTGTIRHYTRRDGLPGLRIMALQFTSDGTLWTMTSHGPASKAPQADAFSALVIPAGLARERSLGPMLQVPDGHLLMGLGDRILSHDPQVALSEPPPTPVFTGHRLNDETFLGPPPVTELTADRKAFSLELGTVGRHAAGAPQFRYRSMPNDRAWQEIGTSQRIDLFDLAPGEHVIEVQASADGVHWSQHTATATVHVLPPLHATWWFRLISAAGVVLVTVASFRSYLAGRLRRQREVFEREQAVLAERMRIAGDMHDDLGAGLSALKLRSEMALRVEKDPEKREQLGSLARTAGELIGNMRQIIWTMNTDQSSLADLISYTTNYARNYGAENGLDMAIELPHAWPAIELSAEQRRNIFLVVKEALHNTVKHAAARTVRLNVKLSGGLVVSIEDDGVGLPKHAQESVGNGLRNMQRRIGALGGTLEMSAGPHGGTTIRFRVPLDTP